MSAKILAFAKATALPETPKPEPKPVSQEPKQKSERKKKTVKHISIAMFDSLNAVTEMIEHVPEMQKHYQNLERINRILCHRDGWMVFHKDMIDFVQDHRKHIVSELNLRFKGLNADDIDRMYRGEPTSFEIEQGKRLEAETERIQASWHLDEPEKPTG